FGDVEKVVAVVGVAHDDVGAACGVDAAHQGVAVAFFFDVNHASAQAAGYFGGTIGRAVVGDEDFAVDVGVAQGALGFFDAGGEGVGFVETGHDDRDFDRIGNLGICDLRLERCLCHAISAPRESSSA